MARDMRVQLPSQLDSLSSDPLWPNAQKMYRQKNGPVQARGVGGLNIGYFPQDDPSVTDPNYEQVMQQFLDDLKSGNYPANPVKLDSGTKTVAGATGTAQGGRYEYVVLPDGSVFNKTTGRITG